MSKDIKAAGIPSIDHGNTAPGAAGKMDHGTTAKGALAGKYTKTTVPVKK